MQLMSSSSVVVRRRHVDNWALRIGHVCDLCSWFPSTILLCPLLYLPKEDLQYYITSYHFQICVHIHNYIYTLLFTSYLRGKRQKVATNYKYDISEKYDRLILFLLHNSQKRNSSSEYITDGRFAEGFRAIGRRYASSRLQLSHPTAWNSEIIYLLIL